MITAVSFLVLAAAGALARAELGRRGNGAGQFPWGTLVVNVSGAFLLGLLYVVAPPALTVLGVGGLGAYTTFSSFAADAVALAERRQLVRAAVYVGATVVLGVGAAAAGRALVMHA
jgi:CrcB protein